MSNNGQINTQFGTIHNAYAIKNNASNISNQISNDPSLTPQQHAEIHAERKANGATLRADKAQGPVTSQERAALRSSQYSIMAQIAGFESC